ncbi:MAG: hypothetical protein PHY31_03940, partial [Smithellaceae bacterium]|nr:hypothetical protein [Smithellaceae bacterium]
REFREAEGCRQEHHRRCHHHRSECLFHDPYPPFGFFVGLSYDNAGSVPRAWRGRPSILNAFNSKRLRIFGVARLGGGRGAEGPDFE